MMAGRIKAVRQALYDELVKVNPDKDWSFVLRQIGMFRWGRRGGGPHGCRGARVAVGRRVARPCRRLTRGAPAGRLPRCRSFTGMTKAQSENMTNKWVQRVLRAPGGAGRPSLHACKLACHAFPSAHASAAPAARRWKVFMTLDGRLSLAGLNKARCEYLAKAMDDSVRNH